jgi:hypothetical protein
VSKSKWCSTHTVTHHTVTAGFPVPTGRIFSMLFIILLQVSNFCYFVSNALLLFIMTDHEIIFPVFSLNKILKIIGYSVVISLINDVISQGCLFKSIPRVRITGKYEYLLNH